jgi:hypothetical protein
MLHQLWFYTYRILIGVIIGLAILNAPLFSHASPEGADLGILVAPPQSLAELVDKAPLIFIGEVGPVEQYLSFGGYDWNGRLQATPTDSTDMLLSGLPVTDLRLQVKEVIRDDGQIARGEPIIVRMLGFATAEYKQMSQAGEYPLSYTGDRHLFVLTPNPDGQSYGFYYGPWSRLIVDGDILRVSNGEQQPLQFGDKSRPVTLEEFIQAVKGE